MRIVKKTDGAFVFAYHGKLSFALQEFSMLCAHPGFWSINKCFRKISVSASFDSLDLRGALLTGLDIFCESVNHVNAENADMYWLSIYNAIISDCVFIRTVLQGARFVNCKFIGCNFQHAKLLRDNLGGKTKIEKCVFENCFFRKANLIGTLFDEVSFVGIDFSRAIMGKDEIGQKTTFKNCTFKETTLPCNKKLYDIL